MQDPVYILDATAENIPDIIEISHRIPVLVDFWASWCQPCKMLLPIMEKLATEYQGRFLLAKVNIDEQQDLATQFAVRSVPTVKLFRNGQIVDEFSGALSESQVREFIDRHQDKPVDKLLHAASVAWQAGDGAQAEQLLQQAGREFPGEGRVQLMQAELLAANGKFNEASKLLHELPADLALSATAEALRAQLAFALQAGEAPEITTLQQQLADNPRDSQARLQLAAQLVQTGEMEQALEQLLELLRSDRHHADDAARKNMLKIFELLGNEGELVSRYRRLMAIALH